MGDAGVEFFFILSGFILTYVHPELFRAHLDRVRVGAFWAARFARIYPVHVLAFVFAMYIVFHAFGFGWLRQNPAENALAFITQLTLTQSWVQLESNFNFNSVAWTISDEAFFYAAFPIVAVAVSVTIPKSKVNAMLLLAAAFWACSAVIAASTGVFGLPHRFPPVRIFDFLIGVCLGVVFANRPVERQKLNYAVATSLEAAAVCGIAAAILYTPAIFRPFQYWTWTAPFSAGIIYIFALGDGALSKLLSTAPLVYLGEISYNFYMLHTLLIVCIVDNVESTSMLAGLLTLVFCVAVSTVVFEVFEKPSRERIRALLTARVSKAVVSA
jgi:peptidoglycan/LPS O-acetylase OafA/YrhL